MEKQKTGVYSPWVVYYNQIKALFDGDQDITTEFDADNLAIVIKVANTEKAEALAKIMPMSKGFGGVTVSIRVVPANVDAGQYLADCFKTAFTGNEAFSHVTMVPDVFTNPMAFCVFKKEVVQYPDDNIFDEHGICSTLYQDIAKKIFGEVDGVFFCTDVE